MKKTVLSLFESWLFAVLAALLFCSVGCISPDTPSDESADSGAATGVQDEDNQAPVEISRQRGSSAQLPEEESPSQDETSQKQQHRKRK